jgi:hypothetical protein
MHGWRLAGLVAACVTWLGVEGYARACTCLEGQSRLVAPTTADLPVGAPLVFESLCTSGLARWTATVDGAPVELLGDGVDFGLSLVSLASAPSEGAELVLTHACGEYTDESDCIDGRIEQITTTIGPADVVAPPPVAAFVVDHEIGMFAERCGEPELHTLRIDATIEIGDREPGAWAVVRAVVDGESTAGTNVVLADEATLRPSLFVRDPDTYAGKDVCVEVAVVDASDNASAASRECIALESADSGCAVTRSEPSPTWLVLLPLLRTKRRRLAARPRAR